MSELSPVVHVVDDDLSFSTAVSRLLRAGGYLVRCYGSAAEFLGAARGDQPGCVLLDLHLPGPSGLELQEALADAAHSLPIVFLTGQGDIPSSVRAMRGGAEDFLTKPVQREILFAAIERALARDARERDRRTRQRELRARLESLTPREREVLREVVRGRLNKQIAARLGTTERTIKAHRANLVSKLGVQSVAELTALVLESDVLELRPSTA